MHIHLQLERAVIQMVSSVFVKIKKIIFLVYLVIFLGFFCFVCFLTTILISAG